MSRWEPDARGRLERAALDLFVEHGFDQVTVPEITARAGLTTRTFFRHFTDKREVLFADANRMPALAARLVLDAPTGLGPADVLIQGLAELASVGFEGRLHELVQRQAIVDGHDGLRERELHKMETLVEAIADAFCQRGVDELTAAVVAETSVGIVKVALRRWMESCGSEQLPDLMTRSLQTLRDVFA
jgi:AcrR family transcriptional regulator